MTGKLLQISIGILLGDATIQKNTSKKEEKWRIKVLQCARHKEYVHHLHNELAGYVRAKPAFDQLRNTYSFSTLFTREFSLLADVFLNNQRKKHISPYFLENTISPVSLAYWFMDDGGLLSYNKDYPRRGVVLNTHGFSTNECELLSSRLNETYGFDSWSKKNKVQTIIAFPGGKWHGIWETKSPHIIPSMRYKFPKVRDGVDDIV